MLAILVVIFILLFIILLIFLHNNDSFALTLEHIKDNIGLCIGSIMILLVKKQS